MLLYQKYNKNNNKPAYIAFEMVSIQMSTNYMYSKVHARGTCIFVINETMFLPVFWMYAGTRVSKKYLSENIPWTGFAVY